MKLLLVGSNNVHTFNYYHLIEGFVEEICIITNGDAAKYQNHHLVSSFSLRNPLSVNSTIQKIKKIITEFSPSVIHVHQANSIAYLVLKAASGLKIPVVVSAWGSDILHTPNSGMMYKKMVKHVLKNAGYFTSDSLYMAYEINRLAGQNCDVTIANFGINISEIQYAKENIIFSNRAHESLYRIDKIISAFALFLKKYPDWKLVLANKGSETESLKKQAEKLNIAEKVEFVGWIDSDTNTKWYAKAKIFASVPVTDATSISLLEAMACGCIPVVSNLPANYEWVIDKYNGVIAGNIDCDFLSPVLDIDTDQAVRMNKYLTDKKALKSINRILFLDLYKRMITENK